MVTHGAYAHLTSNIKKSISASGGAVLKLKYIIALEKDIGKYNVSSKIYPSTVSTTMQNITMTK
jgi:hypothetical protein